jgi:hypothetical protein
MTAEPFDPPERVRWHLETVRADIYAYCREVHDA